MRFNVLSIPTVRNWTSREFFARCLILFTFSALLYVGLHQIFLGGPSPVWFGSSGYGQTARILVDHHLYSENGLTTTVNRPPLYPVFLAGFYAIFGPAANVAAFVAQSLIWIGLGILLVRLAVRWTGDQLVGAFAAMLYATHIEFALEALSQRETLLFTLGVALWLSSLGRTLNTRRAFMLGFACGLLLLTRPTGLVFCAVIPLIFLPWTRSMPGKIVLRTTLIAVVTAFAVTLPWHLYIWRTTGGLDLLPSSTSGENLFKGHFAEFDSVFPWIDLDDTNPMLAELTTGLNERERNTKLKTLGWSAIHADPGQAFRRSFVKIAALYSPLRTPLGEGEFEFTGHQWELTKFRLNRLHFIMLPHALLMIAGTVLFLRRWNHYDVGQRRIIAQVGLTILAVTALHALTFGETRHRLPFDLAFILATAAAMGSRWPTKTPPSAPTNSV